MSPTPPPFPASRPRRLVGAHTVKIEGRADLLATEDVDNEGAESRQDDENENRRNDGKAPDPVSQVLHGALSTWTCWNRLMLSPLGVWVRISRR